MSIVTAILLLGTAPPAGHASELPAVVSIPDSDLVLLKQKLVQDGIAGETVESWFADPRFGIVPEVAIKNVRQPSGTAAYERFIGEESVAEAAAFLKANRTRLEKVLAGNPVDPAVVVAILQVESSLGQYRGTYPLLDVYATLALLNDDSLLRIAPGFWDGVLEGYSAEEHADVRRKARERARGKARWAYRQLKALLVMADEGRMDPLAAKGSWAGAYGMSQFIPTSAEAYAKDGDGDGKIDLDRLEDAAASVANYLKIHRYRHDNPAKRKKAVWHYNHSEEYVSCILTLADRIEATLAADSTGDSAP